MQAIKTMELGLFEKIANMLPFVHAAEMEKALFHGDFDLANEHRILRFDAAFSGGVDAVFQCGYREYVSRRCFVEIRRRYEGI